MEFNDTKLKITLGDHDYLLNFNVPTRRRIDEWCPGFNILTDKVPEYEILPNLIRCAIKPEDRKWKDEDEFFDLVESVDMETLQKIPLAFQNSLGFTGKIFEPVVTKTMAFIEAAEKEIQKAEASKKKSKE